MAAMHALSSSLRARDRARDVPLNAAEDIVARRRWRLLLRLRELVLTHAPDPTEAKHKGGRTVAASVSWPPPPRQYGDVRLILENAALRRVCYRASPTVFAAVLAGHFDLTQEARSSPLLGQLFASFAQDEVVANAAVGDAGWVGGGMGGQGGGMGSMPGAGGGAFARGAHAEAKHDATAAAVVATGALLPEPTAQRQRPRRITGSGEELEELVEQERVVDMRSVVAALILLFPHYGFVAAGAHEQLLCLFEVYCRPGALKGISAAHGSGRRESINFGDGLTGVFDHAVARDKRDATAASKALLSGGNDAQKFDDLGGTLAPELRAGLVAKRAADERGTALGRRRKARLARERAATERQGGAAAAAGLGPLAQELLLPLSDVRALLCVCAVGVAERAHTLGRFERALSKHAIGIGHPEKQYRIVSMVAFDAVLRLSTEYDTEHDGMGAYGSGSGGDDDDWTEEGGAVARSFSAQVTARLLPTGDGAAGYGEFDEGVGLDLGAKQVAA